MPGTVASSLKKERFYVEDHLFLFGAPGGGGASRCMPSGPCMWTPDLLLLEIVGSPDRQVVPGHGEQRYAGDWQQLCFG
jgi:glyoxylase-like metal-dependent hydrolase (beta-lactamase superfamily II)